MVDMLNLHELPQGLFQTTRAISVPSHAASSGRVSVLNLCKCHWPSSYKVQAWTGLSGNCNDAARSVVEC